MFDPLQLVFLIVIIVLTILLVVIGIEVYRILKDARDTLSRVNNVLDDVEVITHSVAGPVQKVSGVIDGLHQGAEMIRMVQGVIGKIGNVQNTNSTVED